MKRFVVAASNVFLKLPDSEWQPGETSAQMWD